MLSKPIASGAMLALLVGVVGAAALQPEDNAQAGVTRIETSDTAPAEPVEQDATAPDRVVESAGFPIQQDTDLTTGPMVTVNGRPLGTPAAAPTSTASRPSSVSSGERAQQPAPSYSVEDDTVQTAVIEPPRPIPRPEGLSVPARGAAPAPLGANVQNGNNIVQENGNAGSGGLDYDAIAGAAYGQPSEPPPARFDDRQALVPPSNLINHPAAENGVVRDPNRDELVGVVGPSGQIIWVYEEQLSNTNPVPPASRVTIQNAQPVNPFGFLYD